MFSLYSMFFLSFFAVSGAYFWWVTIKKQLLKKSLGGMPELLKNFDELGDRVKEDD